MIDWNDPAARAALIERVGPAEYERLQAEHRKASVLETVNGHEIRPVHSSRFGCLFMVGDTRAAYSTIEAARNHAESAPPNPALDG